MAKAEEPRLDDVLDEGEARKRPKVVVGKLAELLEKNGIGVEDIARINRVNAWQGFYTKAEVCGVCGGTGFDPLSPEPDLPNECKECVKGKVRVPKQVDMVGIQLVPTWADGPAWPVIQPAKPTIVKHNKRPALDLGGWKRAVILPDIQMGYFRDRDGSLHPTQDEAAVDVALQVVYLSQPDLIVLVGDNLDFPELSKYRLSPAFGGTTQATVDRAGLFVAQLRAAAGPDCVIVWLAGNHEERLSNYILDNARAAFGLRRANSPDSWPLLSIPELVRSDEHNLTYVPGYPTSEWWINDRLRVIHGHKVRSNGSTAHIYLNEERVSTIYGHIHRREWAERTRATRYGRRTILAASPGCLARLDGKVPSTKGGHDLDGMPTTVAEDWQQGVMVIEYQDGDGSFSAEQVAIHDGWARWRGTDIVAGCDVEGAVA